MKQVIKTIAIIGTIGVPSHTVSAHIAARMLGLEGQEVKVVHAFAKPVTSEIDIPSLVKKYEKDKVQFVGDIRLSP